MAKFELLEMIKNNPDVQEAWRQLQAFFIETNDDDNGMTWEIFVQEIYFGIPDEEMAAA
jgi:hypothetical protein